MTKQPDNLQDDCPLCGGTGEVSISKDGTDKGTDYYGCPVCICRERDEEEARLRAANVDCLEHFNAIKTERDELLAALKSARWRIANLVGPVGAQGLDREALTKIDAAIAKAEA